MCPPDRRDHQTWKSCGMVQIGQVLTKTLCIIVRVTPEGNIGGLKSRRF